MRSFGARIGFDVEKSSRVAGYLTLLAMSVALIISSLAIVLPRPVLGMTEPRPKQTAALGTPVPPIPSREPLDGDPRGAGQSAADPLDGDPLDGTSQTRLEIVRSGRPESAPRSLVAYDDDPETVWRPAINEGDPWLWLDLGAASNVRTVRWLASGSGSVEVSVSDDRRRWHSVDTIEVRPAWQQLSLRDDARYVRLDLIPSSDGAPPGIAEVAVYGSQAAHDATLAQKANKGRKGGKNENKGEKGGKSAKGSNGHPKSKKTKSGKSTSDGNVTAQEGDTHCTGNRDRCRARDGKVSIDDNCQSDGTCTIDVQADGGSATCGAAGGERDRAGKGKRTRGGSGGRCDAAADGGTVTIGDINP